MRSIVIGLGETGGPLREVLGCDGRDKKYQVGNVISKVDILNICIPYSEDFINLVLNYQDYYSPKITIIHSTVPIGTTSKIRDAVHSPILGKHGNMEKSIRDFTKWVGGEKAEEAAKYLREAGLKVRTVPTSEETEALKLICLAKYGKDIVFADYAKSIADKYGFDYSHIWEWDIEYNKHVSEYLRRPLISPPNGKIGGHCVLQNTKILNSQHPSPILEEICKYESV